MVPVWNLKATSSRSDNTSRDAMNPPSEMPNYKPSVFYFRDDLRRTKTADEASRIALVVVNEYERLRNWACEQGLVHPSPIHVAAELLRIAIGMYVCHELEEMKRVVREAGLIPPKWEVSPHEASAKGWTVHETGDVVNF
jgi:hypothetical protein